MIPYCTGTVQHCPAGMVASVGQILDACPQHVEGERVGLIVHGSRQGELLDDVRLAVGRVTVLQVEREPWYDYVPQVDLDPPVPVRLVPVDHERFPSCLL